jgi:hypothetical protein
LNVRSVYSFRMGVELERRRERIGTYLHIYEPTNRFF